MDKLPEQLLLDEISELEKSRDKLKAQIEKSVKYKFLMAKIGDIKAKRKRLEETCTHPEVTSSYKYTSGGYDYRSKTVYFNTCKFCGKQEQTRVDYGYFE